MKFKFDFIPQGAVVKTEGDKFIFKSFFQGKESIKEWDRSSTIIFDTGNQLGDGIIDHHLPGVEDSCVASIVVLKLKSLISNIQEGLEEITLITHFFPDFDAIGGVYYAKKYFETGEMPIGAVTLSEYINEVDSGKLTLDPKSPINPASMILSISDAISKDNSIAFPDKHERILNESFDLLDKITKIFEIKDNPWMPDFLDELVGFDHLKENIKQDVNAYQIDLSNSVTQNLKLINNETGIIDDVDFIATDNPKSFLWKYWVRGDRENSPMGEGFIFTCAFFDTFKDKGRNRAIISTDPNTPYALKGLGLLVDKLEIEKLLKEHNETKETLCENSRPGFHRADPWYDGRAPIHNYTIIDAPRAGSALSNEELLTIIRRYELWQQIGGEIEKWSDFDYVNNFEISDNLFPSEEELNIVLEDFEKFNYLNLENSYELLTKYSRYILEFPVENGYVSIKKNTIREITYSSLTNFLLKLSSFEINEWSLKIATIISKYFPSGYSQRFIQEVKELNLASLKMLINRCINEISGNQVYPLFMYIIDNHKKSFSNLRQEYFSDDCLNVTNEKRANFISQIIKNHNIIEPEISTMENNPIYSLKFFKEFVDNMLVSSAIGIHGKLPESVSRFIRNDFAELFEKYRNATFFDDTKGSYYQEYKSTLFHNLIEPHLGKNLSNFRILRADLLASEVGKKFGKYKKLNPEDFLLLEYNEFKTVFDHFNTILDVENEKQNRFLKYIRIIYSVSILHNLIKRVSKLFDYNSFNTNATVQAYLEEYHPDIFNFRIFIEKFFYASVEQYYKISSDGIDSSMNELVDLINVIKTLPQTTDINYANHVENIYGFINNIIILNDMPLREMDSYIQLVYDQYAFLTKENENYFDSIKSLPQYYSSTLSEIMFSYKKYYSELLYFLQTELNSISDNIQNGNEEHYYYYLSSKLTTYTILYDWEYIKKAVDFSNDQSLSKEFYSKYFTWKQISDQQDSSNTLESFKEISLINSKFRKTIGNPKLSFEDKIQKLEINNIVENFDSHFEYFSNIRDPFDALIHFQHSFYLNSFEYLSDYYIERYDIDTVSKALESFSSSYPKYFTYLTNTKIIQTITLTLIALLIGASAFNSTFYPILEDNTENIKQLQAPISQFINNIIGIIPFNIVGNIVKSFWMVFIGLLFVVPILYAVYKLIKAPFKRKKEKTNTNFMHYLQKIESKRSNLLYLQFITPLLIVLLQVASGDTIDLLNNYTGLRFISLMIIVVGLIYFSVFKDVSGKNPDKSKKWIDKRTTHLFWLYYLQSTIITIFLIDLILRYQIDLGDLFGSAEDYFFLGISKYVYYSINIPFTNTEFDIVLMPIATLLIALMSLFFSFFVDRVFGGGD